MNAIPSPYLIVIRGMLFSLEFLPQEEEIFISRRHLPTEPSIFVRRYAPSEPERVYGVDGMRYELELEVLPEKLELGEKSRDEYDWWDWLNYWYERWFKGGDCKPVPVRYHLKNPVPYEYAELRALVAEILRRDGDCYSQFGADTVKAADHIDKTSNYGELMTYFSRRKFLWMFYEDGKTRRERLKAWCAGQG